jgi:hypothetical protein
MITDAKQAGELAAEHFGKFAGDVAFRVVSSDRGIAATALRGDQVAGSTANSPPSGNPEHRARDQAAGDVAAMLSAWGPAARVGITRDPMGISIGLIRR